MWLPTFQRTNTVFSFFFKELATFQKTNAGLIWLVFFFFKKLVTFQRTNAMVSFFKELITFQRTYAAVSYFFKEPMLWLVFFKELVTFQRTYAVFSYLSRLFDIFYPKCAISAGLLRGMQARLGERQHGPQLQFSVPRARVPVGRGLHPVLLPPASRVAPPQHPGGARSRHSWLDHHLFLF